jgi:hypothetical protein
LAFARSCFGGFVVTLNEALVNEQPSDVSLRIPAQQAVPADGLAPLGHR